MSCVMRKCRNYFYTANKHTGITYHLFPRNELLRLKWIAVVREQRCENDWTHTKYSRVCSAHFNNEDIYTSAKGIRLLKKSALPISKKPNSEDSGPHSPTSLIDVNISDLDSVFDTPMEAALKKEVEKMYLEKRKLIIKNKNLTRSNKILKTRITTMKNVFEEVKKKWCISEDTELNLRSQFFKQNTSVVEAETAIAPEDNDPVLCSGVKKDVVTEQCEDNFKADRRNIHSLYRCSECQVDFKNKHRLHIHINSVHSYETIYSCDYCQKKFTNKEYIEIHMKIKHARGSFKCDRCGKFFKCRQYLMRHKTNIHSANTKCKVCGKSMRPASLKRHVLLKHNDDEQKPNIYVCDYCGKTFTYRRSITFHLYKHATGSFKCAQCQKSFTRKPYLLQHKTLKHTANIKCKICDESMKPGRMKQHVRRMHTDEEVQCKHCGETVKSEYGFQQHVNDHHGHMHDQRDRQTTEDNQQSACSKFREESGKGAHPPEVNAVASASSEQQYEVFIKEEPADQELDLGPVVFQHIDCNYQSYKEEPLLD